MTALLPVRGRLLLCQTTVHASLQHSTVATLTQQQLRTSQLCSLHLPHQLQPIHLLHQHLQLPRPLHLLRPRPHLRHLRQQPQLRQIQHLLHPHLRLRLRPLQHQLHLLLHLPHLRQQLQLLQHPLSQQQSLHL